MTYPMILPNPAPIPADFDDRRRLAVEHMLLALDRNGGTVEKYEFGQIILSHVVSLDEVMAMSTEVSKSLAKRMARGML